MPTLIEQPFRVPGVEPKIIEEHVGKVNTGEPRLSIAHMRAPAGWSEPGQRPRFDEWTLVLSGCMRVAFEGGALDVRAGQTVHCAPGEWVQYSTPEPTEYVAVCLPAFDPDEARRDA
ncbi:MAG: cupin [Deltaproteobacteria bacterium]|nr:MAG: cupin [Deltaproteobacteria bacterium]